ncbi:MAG: EAL domain-containing protein [Pseudomonadales bacterium]|nr:EAL domain-containing protein [Pseudomonadales bacterium]NRA15283.1 EAL domain-containing protein [Oceanospirillaceae bacterium]
MPDLILSPPAERRQSMQCSGLAQKNIYILFVEFSSAESSSIISYLRAHQLSPRGQSTNSVQEVVSALRERSWDLILCKSQQGSFDPFALTKELTHLEKDIPVLQLVEHPTEEDIAEGLKNNMQAVLATDQYDLMLLHIQREYSHLESRRRSRQLQLQLSESQKRCQHLMDNSALAISFVRNQKIVYVNHAFCELFGYQTAELLLNKSMQMLVADQERKGMSKLFATFIDSGQSKLPYQLLAQRADKSNFAAHLELQLVQFNNDECIEIAIDSAKLYSQESKFADIDAITGLYNLQYFTDSLESILRLAQRGGNDCHLLLIDILNVRSTRSQYGNNASRSLIRDTAELLNQDFSKTHLKARIADSLFAVIYLDPNTHKTQQIAEELYLRISHQPTKVAEQTIYLQCAIGIVTLSDTSPSTLGVIERGQKAIRQAQKLTPDLPAVTLYSQEINGFNRRELQSIEQAREAITQQKLRLLFQPLVPLAFSSEQQHYEVLLRMIGADNENIPPARFLTSIDHADLNEHMDRWVLSESISQYKQQLAQHNQLKLFISVTDTVWERQDLLIWVADLLRQSRINADHIVIQLSETECANKLTQASYFVAGLRKLNCLVCLKHYGSTNNSEIILKTLDPDYIKFDSSYIRDFSDQELIDPSFKKLLSNLKSRDKITIVPHVEDPKVMSMLWKSGVCMIQGYYLQVPNEVMDYDFNNND